MSSELAHPWVVAAVEKLRARGQTVGFAESCTGGLLSAIFTRMPGVSDTFMGSFVTYSYDAKSRLLGVAPSLLRVHGAVSLPVARAMAVGAREALGSTWCVSVTGVAGPGGGSEEKPVGTVCFAIAGPGFERTPKVARRHFSGGRREVQMASARYALRLLLAELGVQPPRRMAAKASAGAGKTKAKTKTKTKQKRS